MTLADWIPALSASTILGIIGVVAGAAVKGSIEKGLQHAFDAKLEGLKGDIRKDEEEFKAALRRSDEQVTALRGAALSGVAARNAALGQRRALAVERVWAEVVELGRFKFLSQMAQALNMDELLARSVSGRSEAAKVQQFAATILDSGGFKDPASLKSGNAADKERPFLSPVAWALFSAYRLLVAMPAMQLMLVKGGVGGDVLKDPATQLAPVRAALPEWSKFIDEHQLAALPHLVQPLEDKLLAALVSSLEGKEVDEHGVKQAAQVVEAVSKVVVKMEEAARQAS